MLGTAFCRQSAGKGEPGERGKSRRRGWGEENFLLIENSW